MASRCSARPRLASPSGRLGALLRRLPRLLPPLHDAPPAAAALRWPRSAAARPPPRTKLGWCHGGWCHRGDRATTMGPSSGAQQMTSTRLHGCCHLLRAHELVGAVKIDMEMDWGEDKQVGVAAPPKHLPPLCTLLRPSNCRPNQLLRPATCLPQLHNRRRRRTPGTPWQSPRGRTPAEARSSPGPRHPSRRPSIVPPHWRWPPAAGQDLGLGARGEERSSAASSTALAPLPMRSSGAASAAGAANALSLSVEDAPPSLLVSSERDGLEAEHAELGKVLIASTEGGVASGGDNSFPGEVEEQGRRRDTEIVDVLKMRIHQAS